MQALTGISLLLFVATTAIVGVRMLLLARRTGERPELLMGAGMALVGGDIRAASSLDSASGRLAR
ncbi:MAG TPA: hypothetical protein VKM54_25445 [Myxococcota bacterium]|nr:hypothetical protein [Myxococcota bacterium]